MSMLEKELEKSSAYKVKKSLRIKIIPIFMYIDWSICT